MKVLTLFFLVPDTVPSLVDSHYFGPVILVFIQECQFMLLPVDLFGLQQPPSHVDSLSSSVFIKTEELPF
jgi:hypothetical protein